jgi:hypothetical protein
MKTKKNEDIKVVVAFACQDTIKSKTALSLVCALREVKFDYDMVMSQGCDLIGSRTRLVRQAQKLGATHMLFVDHDMFLFPSVNELSGAMEDPITRLVSLDKDVVGAPYNFRSFPLKSTASPLTEISDKTKPYKCHGLGTGFLLIKMSVFDKIEKPYFQFGRNEDAELVYGEDTWFCQQAIKAGFDVWADPTVVIKHVGDFDF